MPSKKPIEQLRRFLTERFDESEIRIFTASIFPRDLDATQPGDKASLSDRVAWVLENLEKLPKPEDFFDKLSAKRPALKGEVEEIRHQWLAEPPRHQTGWLVWEASEDSEESHQIFQTYWVREVNGKVTATPANVPGLITTSKDTLWELRRSSHNIINLSNHYSLDASAPPKPDPLPIEDLIFIAHTGQALAVDAHFPLAGTYEEELMFYEKNLTVLGGVGPYLFVHLRFAMCYEMAAHPTYEGPAFYVLDLNASKILSLSEFLDPRRIEELVRGEGLLATDQFKDDEELDDDVPAEEPVQPDLTHFALTYTRAGVLELEYRYTFDVCHAKADNQGDGYSTSIGEASDEMPTALQPFRKLPLALRRWRRKRTAEHWGWSTVHKQHLDSLKPMFTPAVILL